MIISIILEGLVAFLFLLTIVTQVIIPLWNSRPLFPILNRRRTDLETCLKTLNELEDDHRLAAELIEHANSLTKKEDIKHD
jgi:cytochrome c-type biogenesis protein CcmH/NrfG